MQQTQVTITSKNSSRSIKHDNCFQLGELNEINEYTQEEAYLCFWYRYLMWRSFQRKLNCILKLTNQFHKPMLSLVILHFGARINYKRDNTAKQFLVPFSCNKSLLKDWFLRQNEEKKITLPWFVIATLNATWVIQSLNYRVTLNIYKINCFYVAIRRVWHIPRKVVQQTLNT